MKKGRYGFLAVVVLMVFVALGSRLVYVTVIAREEIYEKAQNQIQSKRVLPAKRGSILDRNGEVLSSSTEAYRVDADLTALQRKLDRTGRSSAYYTKSLASILGMEEEELQEKLSMDSPHVIIKRKIEKDTIDALRSYIIDESIDFLVVSSDEIRYFPNGAYLAHVLGAVNIDNQGILGLEYYYNDLLKGVDGIKIAEIDQRGRELPFSEVVETPAIEGSDLILSIDEKVQYIIENIADEAMEKHEADSVSILVSDPQTGGVLGMVNIPEFDPNNPFEGITIEEFHELSRNTVVNDAYEPGSTMKFATIAAALDQGVIGAQEQFHCEGHIEIDGMVINCVDNVAHGDLDISGILLQSCNVGTVKIAQRLGIDNFQKYIEAFGFGMPTGIDLPGESAGILFGKGRMSAFDLGVSAIGQSQTMTPVQMLSALNAVVNGGIYRSLHMAEKLHHKEASGLQMEEMINEDQGVRIISEYAAKEVLKGLHHTVTGSLYSGAKIEDIEVFGKTGTAEKIVADEEGNLGYSKDQVVASFIGGAPFDQPKVTILVIVNNPKDAIFGNIVAAPWAKEIFLALDQYFSLK